MKEQVSALDLVGLLSAAENASPADAVDAAAEHLARVFDAECVSFWIADAAGRALLRMPDGERAPLADSDAGAAWLHQEIIEGPSIWVPVTVRGDALGVLEICPRAGTSGSGHLAKDVRSALSAVANCLGYVIVANQMHTDVYEVARRSEPFELSMEIQRRLLPQAYVCEGGSFTLAGWLEPSSTAGGDSFDYIASRDRLTMELVDAVGHDVQAAILATLAVNACRNVRRNGGTLQDQAAAAHQALVRYAEPGEYATGLFIEAPLRTDDAVGSRTSEPVTLQVVNAGHPPPRLIRDGSVEPVKLVPNRPLGVSIKRGQRTFEVHEVKLCPGDRLVLLTDGMYERSAASLNLDELLVATADQHPRNAVQEIGARFREHIGGRPEDDATILVLDWHGGTTDRETEAGADLVQ